jgi:hypothetical protein
MGTRWPLSTAGLHSHHLPGALIDQHAGSAADRLMSGLSARQGHEEGSIGQLGHDGRR